MRDNNQSHNLGLVLLGFCQVVIALCGCMNGEKSGGPVKYNLGLDHIWRITDVRLFPSSYPRRKNRFKLWRLLQRACSACRGGT